MSGHSQAKKRLELDPVQMTEDTMQMLEDRGCIIRLAPGRHKREVERNEIIGEPLYISDEKYGPHKLIAVTADNHDRVAYFGSHPDNEEFLLIGNNDSKPLYLLISRVSKEELSRKFASQTVSGDDFILLRAKFNDPAVSFFTMLKDVVHGELTGSGSGEPPSFYVAESRDLPVEYVQNDHYQFIVRESRGG